MSAFEFATAQRIKFGPGSVRQLGVLTRAFGQRVALVTGGDSLRANGRLAEIEAQFREAEINWLHVTATGEPTVELIDRLAAGLIPYAPEAIVGIGGGSVLDAAKALAALLANGGSTLDYLEGVGRGATLAHASLPLVVVPTTAGTGSEATRNAVIGDAAHTFKKSMRSATMLPALALVDPDLTVGCPPLVIAACGMDAITQLIEAYTSPRSGPITDSLALNGLGYASELPFFFADPTDAEARESLALASLLSGICLANAGLGVVHGLASPLGAFFPIPHGIACAALLAPVLRANIARAFEQEQHNLIMKYSAVFEILAGHSSSQDPFAEDDDDGADDNDSGPEGELLTAGAAADDDDVWPPPDAASVVEGEASEIASEEQIELALAADSSLALVEFLADLRHSLKLPGLTHYGVKPADFDRIIAAATGTSMQTNPVKLPSEDLLLQILEDAL